MAPQSEEFDRILSLAVEWVSEQERMVLREGVPLNDRQTSDARAAGVASPERVRLLKVPQIPLPTHPILASLCEATKALGPSTWGLSVRYGILVRKERAQREVIVHELVHTAQYERLGGIRQFLEPYLHECLTVGYPQSPMEQEAIVTAAKICG